MADTAIFDSNDKYTLAWYRAFGEPGRRRLERRHQGPRDIGVAGSWGDVRVDAASARAERQP